MSLPSEERPLLLLLPGPHVLADALRAVLTNDRVRAHALPPLWECAGEALDVLRALPDVATLDLATLPVVIECLRREATPDALEAHLSASWASLPDRVREWYLARGALAVLGSIFRVGTPAASLAPPDSFRRDRVLAMRFEASYRLHRVPGAVVDPGQPAEEASVVFYPFDPTGSIGRAEAGVPDGEAGASLEVFAYEAGRARHREMLESVASARGWRVVDPPAA